MRIDEIKEIAKRYDIKTGKVAKDVLVRSIQQAEGNMPCFKSDRSMECGQQDCLWRNDCI